MLVYLQGGFGNQLMEYAFGRSLSIKKNTTVTFDKSRIIPCSIYYGDTLLNKPLPIVTNIYLHYALGVYNINLEFAEPEGSVYKEKPGFDPEIYSAPLDTVFDGIWWNEKYFHTNLIRKELSRPKGEPDDETKRIAEVIQSTKNSAFVSVRRGEFIYLQSCLPAEYYFAGMRYIEARYTDTKFFIFSDDRDWCRQQFTMPNCTVVGHSKLNDLYNLGTVHWDLWLMNMCKNSVLSNSSFSWWGAWLNPNSETVVISRITDKDDKYPSKWIRI
jgi:hypothetical protein